VRIQDAPLRRTPSSAAARAFITEDRNVRIDSTAREAWLSRIFEFYPREFLAKAPTLTGYVNRYRAVPIPEDFKIRIDSRTLTGRILTRSC